MPNTPLRGYPYPTPADPVAAGANDIRALAEAVDSDLTSVITALRDEFRAYARGIVARGTMVAGPIVVGPGTAATITSTITWTPASGRRYRLAAQIRAISPSLPAGDAYWQVAGVNSIVPTDQHLWIAGDYDSARFETIFDGTDVAATYYLEIFAATAINVHTEGPASFFYLEDVGAA